MDPTRKYDLIRDAVEDNLRLTTGAEEDRSRAKSNRSFNRAGNGAGPERASFRSVRISRSKATA